MSEANTDDISSVPDRAGGKEEIEIVSSKNVEMSEGQQKKSEQPERGHAGYQGENLRLRNKVQQLENQIIQLNLEITRLESELSSIHESVIFSFMDGCNKKMVKWFIPLNTRRWKYYDLGKRGFRILAREGPGSFFAAISRYFHEHKKIEKTFYQSQKWKEQSGKPFNIGPSDFLPLNTLRIAVHVHLYYIDLFNEISRYLENIPVKYSLFISVTQEEHKKIILQKIGNMPLVDFAEVRVVRNRGRDIAPFLVDFRPYLYKYDYICHIHTKKSLSTGEEKDIWRRYLYERLLGSKDLVSAILTAFVKDASLGIIYPEMYPYIPYWGCTWLSNKGIARSFLKRLNIRFDPDEYLNFPAGSMFWIRREALEPLLDIKLHISDFPEESGQTDGTLQHVLERCFVLVAQDRGFHHLVVLDPGTQLFSYASCRNIYQYIDLSFREKLVENLESIKIISFDIFDTLLIRPFATPDMVFCYLETLVGKEFGIMHFKDLRIRAEAIARERKHNNGDVKLSEIYSVFSELAKIDTSTAFNILDLEVATEKKILIPQAEVIESARYAKNKEKRLILVSDSYFERSTVEQILRSKGIDFFDEIYMSCEYGKRKDRGDLWDYIIQSEGITQDNFMHIGDNEQSDVQQLRDRGLKKIIHIMRPGVLFRQSDPGRRLWELMAPYRGWRENLLFGKIANRLCSNVNKKQIIESSNVFDGAYSFGYIVFGPIIFNFMNWLIKNAERDRCQHLWFLSREGYLLNDIFSMIMAQAGLRNSFPSANYFLSSRRAALFAALESVEDIPLLLEGRYKGTLRDFLTKRLLLANISQIEASLGPNILDKPVSLPDDHQQISDHLARIFNLLLDDALSQRELLRDYCRNLGFEEEKSIAVVDLGYSGTIQYALAKVLQKPVQGYYFVTTSRISRLSSVNAICRAYYGENIEPRGVMPPIYKYSLLLEAVLTSPDGQLIRFEQEKTGGIHPVFKDPGLSQREFETVRLVHEGIRTFVKEMYDQFGPSAIDIEFPRDLVQLCFKMVAEGDIGIGSLDAMLSVEDEYCGNQEISPLGLYQKKRHAR